MQIEIISTESLGARGMCTMVKTKSRRILIDPGIALGLVRHGLLPHPCQISRGAELREKIVVALMQATDVILSHYHGDHIPLEAANPYQLSLKRVAGGLENIRLWGMSPQNTGAAIYNRAKDIEESAGMSILPAEGHHDGQLQISEAMPHGLYSQKPNMVVMSRIEEDGFVFVHASDIQLIERNPVQQIIDWHPDVVFVSGPPLYIQTLSAEVRAVAWENALALAKSVGTVVIDHHLLRCLEGVEWLERVARESGNRVLCAADFQNKRRRFLEAERERFYRVQPVSEGWHDAYEDSWKQTNMYS
ncbi:MAG: MBL fold metallo-hydrolase [Desulfatiglandaceae bacterium]